MTGHAFTVDRIEFRCAWEADGYVWRSAGGYAARCLGRWFETGANGHKHERARYAAHAVAAPLGDEFPTLLAAFEACERHLRRHGANPSDGARAA